MVHLKQTMLLLGAVTCGTRQVSAIKRLAVGVTRGVGVGVGDALSVGFTIRRDTIGNGKRGLANIAVRSIGQWKNFTDNLTGQWKGRTRC